MKIHKLLLFASSLSCVVFSTPQSANAATEDEKSVAKEVAKMFKITSSAKKLESPALKKVTEAQIFDVKVEIQGPDTNISTTKMRVMKGTDGVSPLVRPSTNQECPVLKKMIKKDFKLKMEEDAKVLEAALDELYPISDGFGGRDHKEKAIWRGEGRVVFVRGVFFKDLKAFIFEIDEAGTIKKIDYSLGLKRK